jgi:hypothetical protein
MTDGKRGKGRERLDATKGACKVGAEALGETSSPYEPVKKTKKVRVESQRGQSTSSFSDKLHKSGADSLNKDLGIRDVGRGKESSKEHAALEETGKEVLSKPSADAPKASRHTAPESKSRSATLGSADQPEEGSEMEASETATGPKASHSALSEASVSTDMEHQVPETDDLRQASVTTDSVEESTALDSQGSDSLSKELQSLAVSGDSNDLLRSDAGRGARQEVHGAEKGVVRVDAGVQSSGPDGEHADLAWPMPEQQPSSAPFDPDAVPAEMRQREESRGMGRLEAERDKTGMNDCQRPNGGKEKANSSRVLSSESTARPSRALDEGKEDAALAAKADWKQARLAVSARDALFKRTTIAALRRTVRQLASSPPAHGLVVRRIEVRRACGAMLG